MEQKNLENLTNPEQALLERMEQLFPDMEPSRLAEGFDALVQAHPEADLAGLCTDELFIQYASGRSEPLDVLYESYRHFDETLSQEVERRVHARTQRASGSSAARTSPPGAGLSQAQASMLAEWNRAYPEYAMSTREYAAMLKNA